MTVTIMHGDARDILPTLPSDHFDCIVTSPPYWGLRDYGVERQIGLEPTLDGYIETMVGVCRDLRRVLKPNGTFWLNIGDAYAGSWGAQSRGEFLGPASKLSGGQIYSAPKGPHRGSLKRTPGLKEKDLCMIPNRLAIRLQEDGWWVRSEIIWHKPNPMPESATDRPTSAHEKVWLLTKGERYFYDAKAISKMATDTGRVNGRDGRNEDAPARPPGSGRRTLKRLDYSELGRNARNVWSIASQPYRGAHFATMPRDLAERCIKAGCPAGGHVLDPFGGAGTTGLVADRCGLHATLIELNPDYAEIARSRIAEDAPLFAEIMSSSDPVRQPTRP